MNPATVIFMGAILLAIACVIKRWLEIHGTPDMYEILTLTVLIVMGLFLVGWGFKEVLVSIIK